MSLFSKLSMFFPLGIFIIAVGMLVVFFIKRKSLSRFWKIVLPAGACCIILTVILVWIVLMVVARLMAT